MSPSRQELSQIHDYAGPRLVTLTAVALLASALTLVPLFRTDEPDEAPRPHDIAAPLAATQIVEETAEAAGEKLTAAAPQSSLPQPAVSDEKAAALAAYVAARAGDVASLRATIVGNEVAAVEETVVPRPIASLEVRPRAKTLGVIPADHLKGSGTKPSLPATIELPVGAAKHKLQLALAAAQAKRHAKSPPPEPASRPDTASSQGTPIAADSDLAKRAADLFVDDGSADDETGTTDHTAANSESVPRATAAPATQSKRAASPAKAKRTAQRLGWVVRRSTVESVSEESLDSLGRAETETNTPNTASPGSTTRTAGGSVTRGAKPRAVAAPAIESAPIRQEPVTSAPSSLSADNAPGVAGHKMQAQILFQEHSATLTPQAQASLTTLAQRLMAQGGERIMLFGYSSGEVDRSAYSSAHTSEEKAARARLLALSRTMAVRRFLMGRGVPSHRLFGRALGSRVAGGPADRVDIMLGQI